MTIKYLDKCTKLIKKIYVFLPLRNLDFYYVFEEKITIVFFHLQCMRTKAQSDKEAANPSFYCCEMVIVSSYLTSNQFTECILHFIIKIVGWF